MKQVKLIARIVLALPLVIFGLNGFLQFMPMPEVGAEAGAFLGAIASTKSFFPIISIVEVAAGIMLLSNKAVPLALIMVFPILLCANLYHIALDPAGLLYSLVCLILIVALMFFYKDSYKQLLVSE